MQRLSIFLTFIFGLATFVVIGWMWVRSQRAGTTLSRPGIPVKQRTDVEGSAQVADMPRILQKMRGAEGEMIFTTFIFYANNNSTESDLVNLNVYEEHGGQSFDWYLGAPRNIADKDAFLNLAASKGWEISFENDGASNKIYSDDPGAICIIIATEMYGLSLDDRVEVMEHW